MNSASLPKVCLPIPLVLGPRFRNFVARRETVRDAAGDAVYLTLTEGEQAPHGERVPVGALIRLTRRSQCPTHLAGLARSAAVRTIIDHGAAPHLQGGAVLAIDTKIAARVPAFDLAYSVGRRAADALVARFGRDHGPP